MQIFIVGTKYLLYEICELVRCSHIKNRSDPCLAQAEHSNVRTWYNNEGEEAFRDFKNEITAYCTIPNGQDRAMKAFRG